MANINKVFLSGNLTRDPELRATTGGTDVLSFSVAANDRRNVDGKWQDVPNYIDCVMFGNRSESLARYLVKGTKVSIEGKLRYSSWTDRQTEKRRSKIEVIVDEIELMGGRKAEREEVEAQDEQPPVDVYDDDIPF